MVYAVKVPTYLLSLEGLPYTETRLPMLRVLQYLMTDCARRQRGGMQTLKPHVATSGLNSLLGGTR